MVTSEQSNIHIVWIYIIIEVIQMIGVVLSAIFVPACVILVFSIMQKNSIKRSKEMTDSDFTVRIPDMVIIIGAMGALMGTFIMLLFTFVSDEYPDLIFYVFFGLYVWVGIYLIVKTITFKVIVKGEKITVFSIFKKPYTFTFDEIVSVVRQVKKNKKKSERLVIKTAGRKRLIVENIEIAYQIFLKKIQSEVKKEYLHGFE